MPKRLRPAYIVERSYIVKRKDGKYVVSHKNEIKELYRTKKEICEAYRINLAAVNFALIGYSLCTDGKTSIRIKYYTCKNCDKYLTECLKGCRMLRGKILLLKMLIGIIARRGCMPFA